MGKIVERQVRRSMVSISDLSRDLNVNRRTLYNWFTKKSIPDAIIINIGEIIGYNFSDQIPQLAENDNLRNSVYKVNDRDREDETYKTKYLLLLEKYNRVLEDMWTAQLSSMNQ